MKKPFDVQGVEVGVGASPRKRVNATTYKNAAQYYLDNHSNLNDDYILVYLSVNFKKFNIVTKRILDI